ncbi:hypothetical protein F4824DRAFT_289763 [Ustulina deusta]|nr:hypothetical protein F4824DRAFT_289763 [Ustulina deusta]
MGEKSLVGFPTSLPPPSHPIPSRPCYRGTTPPVGGLRVSVCLSVCLSICPFAHFFAPASFRVVSFLPVRLAGPLTLSIYLSIYLSIHPSVCPPLPR